MAKIKKFQSGRRLMRNQVSSLVIEEKVVTTKTKAKVLKTEMERVLSRVKRTENELERLRYLKAILYGGAVKKLLDNPNKFTSVSKIALKNREGDNAPLAVVVLNSENMTDMNKKESGKK